MALETLTNVGFGGSGYAERVPKILAELQGLTFSLITGAAGGTLMPIAGIEAEDTIKEIVNLTDLTEGVIANVTIQDRRPTGTITCLTTLVDGDTVTVNAKVYTFRAITVSIATNLGPGIVPITILPSGVDVTVTAAKLRDVIMSSDSTLVCTSSAGVVTIRDRTPGTAGNSKNLLTSSAHATVSAATLTGGAAAGGANGIKSTDSYAAKKMLVIWFNKTP